LSLTVGTSHATIACDHACTAGNEYRPKEKATSQHSTIRSVRHDILLILKH
jgi:hypothetical protein